MSTTDSTSRPVTSRTIRLKTHHVLLKPVGEDQITDQTEGGLWLPDQAKDRQRYRQWEVIEAGPETPLELQPGMRVIVDGRFAGQPLHLDDGEFRLMYDHHIIAALPQEEVYDD